MYYFTSDEHYGHRNILKYCARPFSSVEEMDETLIANHNAVVKDGDVVVHAGDFALVPVEQVNRYIERLQGSHIFLEGSHDRWLDSEKSIWKSTIDGQAVVVCHYAMRVWWKSHYNSWMLYGHSHGRLPPIGKQWDVGVDCNGFTPVSWKQIKEIMAGRPDNPGLVDRRDRE